MPSLSLESVKAASSIQEESSVRPAGATVKSVLTDSRHLLELLTNAIQVAEREGQRGTVSLFDEVRDQEEKALWILSACLEQSGPRRGAGHRRCRDDRLDVDCT